MKVKPLKHKLYEGSSKVIYQGQKDYTLIQFFKDDLKIDDKQMYIAGKGIINNSISAYIMNKMSLIGINHHLIQKINMREQLIHMLYVIPIKICITGIASGRYVSQFGIEEGYVFDVPMIDFRVKNSDQGDPIINESQIIEFHWAEYYELKELKKIAMKCYHFLTGLFAAVNIRLVECQLEFGRSFNNEDFTLTLADEITPDTCKLWDMNNNIKLGHEKALHSNGNELIHAYQEIAQKFGIL